MRTCNSGTGGGPALDPAPATVVITGGADESGWPATTTGPDASLLKALPLASHVLEVGFGSPALALAYKRTHPGAHWTAADFAGGAGATGREGVDGWCRLGDLSTLPARAFDLLVVNEVLAWLPDPLLVLRCLARLAAPDARLLLSAENHASLSTLERLLDSDLSADRRQSPAAGQPRLQSPATIYKLLMDAGWMPTLADGHCDPLMAGRTRATLKALVQASGLAVGCPGQVHSLDRIVIEARRTFADAPVRPGPALFTVLVPTNNDRQLRVNVEQSSGLKEVGARIVSCRGASSPAEAFDRGLTHVDTDWVLLCHQDVYFPAGFGEQLNAILAAIGAEERTRTLLGFIGLGALPNGQGTAPRGFVIDRLHRADHPDSSQGVSIDEVALVLSRDTLHRIDPELGWDLWATDLCLQAICRHQVFPRLVRAPLFHNSRTGWTLPAGFGDAAHRLAAKWGEDFGAIPTLCGVIDAAFLAANPKTTE